MITHIPSRSSFSISRIGDSPFMLAIAFIAVHGLVGWHAAQLHGMGDVRTYSSWASESISGGKVFGITRPWVYPVLALPPILLAGIAGPSVYLLGWIAIATVSDLIVVVLLRRRRAALAWWFLLVILLLGPISQARIDEVVLPFAIGGVLLTQQRPAMAAVLFTLGAWIKVWPALMVVTLLVASKRRVAVLAAAAATCLVVVGGCVLLGARGSLFSFVGTQSARGLQIEAPVAAPFLWSVALKQHGAHIFFDKILLTEQVAASGSRAAAAIATPILATGVLAIIVLSIRASVLGVSPERLLPYTGLGLVSTVVALNKVGSPQYVTWFIAPVILGLIGTYRRWWFPSVVVPVVAALTQVIYPTAYPLVLKANPAMLTVLDIRDILELALFAWAVIELARLPRGPRGPVISGTGAEGPPLVPALPRT